MEKTKEEIKEEIEKEIKDSVDDFIGTIKKEPCCEYFSDKTEADWECEKVYKDALYQGYLDACRTIHWSTKAREEGYRGKSYERTVNRCRKRTLQLF